MIQQKAQTDAKSPVLDFQQFDSWETLLPALAGAKGVSDICINSMGRIRIKGRGFYAAPILYQGSDFFGHEWTNLRNLIHSGSSGLKPGEFQRDSAFSVGNVRFRASWVQCNQGEELTLRILPSRIPQPEEIHLPNGVVSRFCDLRDGLVAFVGATGDGKSTSIASLVSEYARRSPRRVVTIEDPVEYLHEEPGNGSTFTYRSVGVKVESFAAGVRAALRMQPDLIVIGECRDSETAAVILDAALSGHLVVTTFHGGCVTEGMQRMADFCREKGKASVGGFAQCFRMCVAQRLYPSIHPLHAVAAVHEVMTGTNSVRVKIRDESIFTLDQAIQSGRDDGMQTFEQSSMWKYVRDARRS